MTLPRDGSQRQPRWETARDRLQREVGPLQRWVYRQWWLYAVAGVGFVAVPLFDAEAGTSGGTGPALVLGGLLLVLALLAFRYRRG